jgi:hypothetical protein
VAQLEQQPNVVKVWLDTPIAPFTVVEREVSTSLLPTPAMGPCPIPPCDCTFGNPANGTIGSVANHLGVDQLWQQGLKGQGIVVGVVDSGLNAVGRTQKPGETAKVPNVIDGAKADWGTTSKWGRHGNMCATDVLGMAPQAQLYDLRLPDSTTDSLSWVISDAIAAFQWAINRHMQDGTPHVLTNSWGIFEKSWDPVYACDANHPFTTKVVEAVSEGIIVLFAAGNCGQTCPDGRCNEDNGPGKSIWGANSHPKVITVGAVNLDEEYVGYSSQGPGCLDPKKPDVCAITHFAGYFPDKDPAAPSDGGTSAATPICAGVAALLKQAKAGATPAQIKKALQTTAKNIGPAGWDQHTGFGLIRARAAKDKLTSTATSILLDFKLKFVDDITVPQGDFKLKVLDDTAPQGDVKLKINDDGTAPAIDVKLKIVDDGAKAPGDVINPPIPLSQQGTGWPSTGWPSTGWPATGWPFILATPHHAQVPMSWPAGSQNVMQPGIQPGVQPGWPPGAGTAEMLIAHYEAVLAVLDSAVQSAETQAEALRRQRDDLAAALASLRDQAGDETADDAADDAQ